MNANGIAESALREIAAEARRKDPSALVIAVQAPGYAGKPTLALEGGEQLSVHWCRSVLELRQRLTEAREQPVVLVTDREERELGEDALGYLARGRLLRVGLWEPVKAHFKARGVSPQAVRLDWLPEALMRHMPAGGHQPAPSGVLTLDHALGCLSRVLLGAASPTTVELLEAVASGSRAAGLESERPEVIKALGEYHSARLGPVSSVLLATAVAHHGSHTVALGLAAQVIFGSPAGSLTQAQTEATVRLERYTGGMRVSPAAGAAWGSAAERLVSEAPPERGRTWEDDADRLLDQLGVAEQAALSGVLEAGLSARIALAAEALAGWLNDEGEEPRRRALAAVDSVRTHRRAEAGLVARLLMAARLIQLIHSPEPPDAASFGEAARLYTREGGLLDLAREALDFQEHAERLRELYSSLTFAVDERRHRRAQRFAKLLAAATEADRDDGLLPVERVLEDVVTPVARAHPVLVLVLDGMSEAAFRRIAPTIEWAGWRQATPRGELRTPAVAVLPSLTRVSRASLLAGKLVAGTQSVENSGFAEALHDVGTARLFHKAEVASSNELREALADSSVRVVGVVVNAIDDMLDKGDQVVTDWTLDRIGPLRLLLDAAAESGRAVILASDHGHVLERGAEHRANPGGGSRWRPNDPDGAREGEVLLRGRRVLEGDGAVIAPATEKLRYRARSAGYHGGATPQEVVAPVAVYLPALVEVPGFDDVAPDTPEWWDLTAPAGSAEPPTAPTRTKLPAKDQGQLFGVEPEVASPQPEWIERLLESPQYGSQRERAHKPPPDKRIAVVLAELDRRGGIAAATVIAEVLGVGSLRGRTLISSMQPVLNVDGYRVLMFDSATGEVRLDRAMLNTQFGL